MPAADGMGERPLVALLYNPAVPHVVVAAGSLVEMVEVIPDRLWYDFGPAAAPRFRWVPDAIDTLRGCVAGKVVVGHGIGLSLPSAMPVDEALMAEVVTTSADLGFRWYSEHLSMFVVPNGSVPNAQAGLGMPVVYDAEMLDLLGRKVTQLSDALGLQVLLENPTVFTPVSDAEMTEPQFLNALCAATGCGVLLDLHNLYANTRNNDVDAAAYLDELEPDNVMEIHLAGGDELLGFYTDSHSRLTPPEVWEWAYDHAPRFSRLRAITFEFHESYYARLRLDGVVGELERMHRLADTVAGRRRQVVGAI